MGAREVARQQLPEVLVANEKFNFAFANPIRDCMSRKGLAGSDVSGVRDLAAPQLGSDGVGSSPSGQPPGGDLDQLILREVPKLLVDEHGELRAGVVKLVEIRYFNPMRFRAIFERQVGLPAGALRSRLDIVASCTHEVISDYCCRSAHSAVGPAAVGAAAPLQGQVKGSDRSESEG